MAFGDLLGVKTTAANSITNPTNAANGASFFVYIGDLIFAVIGEQTSLTVTGCFDNLGNTYTAVNAGTDGVNITGRAFYTRVTTVAALTQVSFTATASANNVSAVALAIRGPFTAAPLDAAPGQGTTDVTTPFVCPASGALGQADEVVFAWSCAQTGATWTATAPNTKGADAISQSVSMTIVGYQTVATTASVSPQFTGTNPSTSIVLGTVSFRKDPNAPPYVTTGMFGVSPY